jgi:hypothetical protein
VTDRRKLLFIRIALVAGALLLLAPPWKDWLMEMYPPVWSESISGLLKGIGEAFIVALVLELLVDAPLKHRLVDEIIDEVAPRILAHLLPPKVFRYIEENLLRQNLVRRSWDITYRITPVENKPYYVKLETVSRYDIANVAPSPVTYPAVYEVERSLFPDIGETDISEVTVRNLLIAPDAKPVFKHPDGADTAYAPKVVGNYVSFSKPFEIPVHKESSAMQFVFCSTEYFHVGSIVPFFAKYLVEKTTLRVIYPKETLQVIVDFPANNVSELHPDQEPSGDDSYTFPKPILPGQGFTVRFPKRQ